MAAIAAGGGGTAPARGFHSHSYIGAGLSRWMAGEALRRADASVIAACRFVAEPWTKFVPPERVKVIYNGVRACANRRAAERRAADRLHR